MKNIMYINAGAGSGKTTRLTEILSEKLGNGDFRPSEVILTTFTELAASEFREKSRERLFNDDHPDIAAELDSATIGTVHSVALSFIQKYWYLIGVSPDMKVMSEDDLQVYISESLGNYVDRPSLEFFREYCKYFDLKDSQSHTNLDFWKDDLLSIIDKVYDDFEKRYKENPVDDWQDFLYKICVRLVFWRTVAFLEKKKSARIAQWRYVPFVSVSG